VTAIVWALFAVLAATSALHVYWALGGLWPGRSYQHLVDTVIGGVGRRHMPPAALTLLVAALIFAAGAWPVLHLMGALTRLPGWVASAGLWMLVLVFTGRGLVTYVLRARAAAMSEPFATLNRRYYSPLCLVLGVGFLVVAAFS